jgi:hypothetical protein
MKMDLKHSVKEFSSGLCPNLKKINTMHQLTNAPDIFTEYLEAIELADSGAAQYRGAGGVATF